MRALTTSLLAVALGACAAPSDAPEPNRPESPTPAAERAGPDIRTAAEGIERDPPRKRGVTFGDGVTVDLHPAAEVPTRPRRRMDLDQLAQAMLQTSGNVGWTERRGNNTVDLFEELAGTLGRPDYVQVTNEDLDPSALFLKFLDDAARSVCAATLTADLSDRLAEDRVILLHSDADDGWADAPGAIDANLAYLVQRFHGRTVTETSASVAAWRWLFQSVEFVTGDPLDGWNAVCVGLYTHPDFYSY